MGTNLPVGYTGAYQDRVTGDYPLGNGYRMYLPELMRFNSPDSWSPFSKGGIHPYAYCAGDPINHADPSGHFGRLGLLGVAFMLFLAPEAEVVDDVALSTLGANAAREGVIETGAIAEEPLPSSIADLPAFKPRAFRNVRFNAMVDVDEFEDEDAEARISAPVPRHAGLGRSWRYLENLEPLPEGAGASDYLDQVEGMLTDVTGDLGMIQQLNEEKDRLQDLVVTKNMQSRFDKPISRLKSSSRQKNYRSSTATYTENVRKVLGAGRTHLEQARRLMREQREDIDLRTRLDTLSQQLNKLDNLADKLSVPFPS